MNVVPTVIIPIIDNEKIDFYWSVALRAVKSVLKQTVESPLIVSVGSTHAEAKNKGVDLADTEWCMFLDADDTIDPEFVEHLEVSYKNVGLLKPQCYINGVHMTFPVGNLLTQNFLINACVFKKEKYEEVGGAEDRVFPDWFLWAKMLTDTDMVVQEVDSRYNYLKTNLGLNARSTPEDNEQTRKDIKAYFEDNKATDLDELIPKVVKGDNVEHFRKD